jgi:hypothetical protein
LADLNKIHQSDETIRAPNPLSSWQATLHMDALPNIPRKLLKTQGHIAKYSIPADLEAKF